MPIKTLQRRLTEVGRLRLGHKESVLDQKTGKQRVKDGRPIFRPARGEQWRLTSPYEELLLHAAGIYGGDVKPWVGAPEGADQFELYTDSDTLNVLVPPGQALSQWLEAWQRGLCARRCDGETEVITGEPCVCAAETAHPKDYRCRPTTRLSVVLSDVPSVGVWRCELHGWHGATELLGMATLLEDAGLAGRIVPATLALEQRTIPAKPNQPTRHIVLPVLQPLASWLQQLALAGGPGPAGELEASRPAVEAGGEVYDNFTEDTSRPGGTPNVARAAGPTATTMRAAQAEATQTRQRHTQPATPTVPTFEQVEALKSVGEAKTLYHQADPAYKQAVDEAINRRHGMTRQMFSRDAVLPNWVEVLTTAIVEMSGAGSDPQPVPDQGAPGAVAAGGTRGQTVPTPAPEREAGTGVAPNLLDEGDDDG